MGMTEKQKARLRTWLDSFSFNNGGCLLCNQGNFQFYFDTGLQKIEEKSYPVVTLYGLCRTCDRDMQQLGKKIDAALDACRRDESLKIIVNSDDVHPHVHPKTLVLHFVPEPKKKITLAELRKRSNPLTKLRRW